MKLTSSQLRRIIAEEVRSLKEAQKPESEFRWDNLMKYSPAMQAIVSKLPGLHDSFIAAYEEKAAHGDVRSDMLIDVLIEAIADSL